MWGTCQILALGLCHVDGMIVQSEMIQWKDGYHGVHNRHGAPVELRTTHRIHARSINKHYEVMGVYIIASKLEPPTGKIGVMGPTVDLGYLLSDQRM